MRFLGIFPLLGLLAIGLLLLSRVRALRRNGVSVRAGKASVSRTGKLLYWVFAFVALVWMGELVVQLFRLPRFLLPAFLTQQLVDSPLLEVSGAVMIILAVVFMFLTLRHFKTSLRFGMNRENQGELITEGIFSCSRNPFFLSLILYFIGQAMIFPGVAFMVLAVLAIISIHFFILKEEKFLMQHYRDEYREYKRKVRRYL